MLVGGPTWKGENEKEFRKERKALIEKLVSSGVVCIAAVGNNGLYGIKALHRLSCLPSKCHSNWRPECQKKHLGMKKNVHSRYI